MCNMNMPMTKKLHNDYNDCLNNSFADITTTNYFHMETSISSDFSIYEYIFHNIPQLYWPLPCDWYSVIIIKTNVTCQSESTICGDVEVHKVLGVFLSVAHSRHNHRFCCDSISCWAMLHIQKRQQVSRPNITNVHIEG